MGDGQAAGDSQDGDARIATEREGVPSEGTRKTEGKGSSEAWLPSLETHGTTLRAALLNWIAGYGTMLWGVLWVVLKYESCIFSLGPTEILIPVSISD